MIADAIDYNYTQVGMQTHSRRKRSCDMEGLGISCGTLGATCGITTVGCAICTFFSFGTCITVCGTDVAAACWTVIAGYGVSTVVCTVIDRSDEAKRPYVVDNRTDEGKGPHSNVPEQIEPEGGRIIKIFKHEEEMPSRHRKKASNLLKCYVECHENIAKNIRKF